MLCMELIAHAGKRLGVGPVDSARGARNAAPGLPSLRRSSSREDGRPVWDAIVWRQAVDQAQLLCLIVDRSGRVFERSAAAASLLESGGSLRLQGGRLSASTPQDTQRLRQQIGSAATGSGIGQRQHTFSVGALYVRVLPLGGRGGSPPNPKHIDCALILIRKRTRRRPPTAAAIRTQLQCTSAEAQIAAALAAGHSPRQIATQRRVSINTIRAQVRALFADTGVRRIGELVAFLAGL
jgi:DNA-binding CsgD family transcriptional regulator